MSDTIALKNKEDELKKLRTMRLVRTLLPIVGLFLVFILFNFLTDGRMVTHLPLALSQVYVIMIASMGVFFIMTMGGLDFSQGSIFCRFGVVYHMFIFINCFVRHGFVDV